jgi:superfamily II DNA/RNA helicase
LFNENENFPVLIGTDAMSAGLNLQIAKFVINIDQPDTYAIKIQRIGRARRAGSQFDNVIVYDMITSSTDSVKSKDEERLENIEKNKDLSDALVSIDNSQRQALINAMKTGG